jgi:RNA polymerase II subunit A small phosphatase-like protein
VTNSAQRRLLVLDLDETLIHSSRTLLDREHECQVGVYNVYFRPHVRTFLEKCQTWYGVGIWSAGSETYVADVIQRLFVGLQEPEFTWSHNACTWWTDWESRDRYIIKKLKKLCRLGYHLDHILVIDDIPNTFCQNYGNGIAVKPWYGAQDDDELLQLLPFLEWLSQAPNLRSIEKRNWNTRAWSGLGIEDVVGGQGTCEVSRIGG